MIMLRTRIRPSLLNGLLSGLLSLFAAACTTVGPDYQRPALELDPQYAESRTASLEQDVTTSAWWTQYNDPVLNALVNDGLRQNLDIALATERIAQARASLQGYVRTNPSGSAGYDVTRSGGNATATTTSRSTSLSGSLVLDLFGGRQREREAAAAQLQGAIDDVGTARLAYLSELIGAYIEARYYQYAGKLTRESIASRGQTLAITRRLRATGNGTELDVQQVNALLFSARADLPDLQASYLAQVYTIATLLNQSAQAVTQRLQGADSSISLPGLNLEVPTNTGIPADLVRNRPDVRSAEQNLVASTASVGVATADMLPSVTLSGSIVSADTLSWQFGPAINLPVFNQPQLAAQRRVAVSQARQAEITWRQTILDAVRDVQTANSAWLRDKSKVDNLGNAVKAYERSLALASQTYRAGITDLLNVLDTDRSLASARIAYANALRAMAVNWATLQVALGAGSAATAD